MRSACLLSSSVARVSLELMFFITKFQNRAQLVLARVIGVVATMLVFDRKGCYNAVLFLQERLLSCSFHKERVLFIKNGWLYLPRRYKHPFFCSQGSFSFILIFKIQTYASCSQQ